MKLANSSIFMHPGSTNARKNPSAVKINRQKKAAIDLSITAIYEQTYQLSMGELTSLGCRLYFQSR